MLFLFLRTSLADSVRGIERNDVIFLGVLQHRGNSFKVLLHGAFFYRAISTRPLAQLLAHFLQRQRADFGKRNPADEWTDNFQITLIPGQRSGFEVRFLPVQPCLGVTVKVRLVAFFYAILELLLDALRLSHNVLLDTALGYG